MLLEFKVDTKERKQWFTAESFAHPAKMSLPLELWLIEKYTKPGDVILDPMAGIGTILVGATLGRNIICVELEEKFCRMMLDNAEKIMQRGTQMGYEMGRVDIIQGDARNLEELLVDGIITSPPYSEGLGHQHRQYGRDIEASKSIQAPEYSQNPNNIGNLPYGQIDKIVTSPPYAESVSATTGGERVGHQIRREQRLKKKGYNPKEFLGGKGRVCQVDWEYSGSQDNIGNLPYGNVDAVISSPPYEDSLSEPEDRKHSIDQSKWGDGRKIAPPHSQVHLTYPSSSSNNIGNLKSQSYLEAMLQVYQQCHKVLKPSGLMILVTKNFIRDKQVVRLDLDTIKLCEQAGFKLLERHYRKLPAQSFWRVIYQKKYPWVEKLELEDILVFKTLC